MKAILPINDPANADKEIVARLQTALEFFGHLPQDPPVTAPTGDDLALFVREKDQQAYGDITKRLVSQFRHAANLLVGDNVDSVHDATQLPKGNPPVLPPLTRPGLRAKAYRDILRDKDTSGPWEAGTDQNDSFVIYADLDNPDAQREPQQLLLKVFSGQHDGFVKQSNSVFGRFAPIGGATQESARQLASGEARSWSDLHINDIAAAAGTGLVRWRSWDRDGWPGGSC